MRFGELLLRVDLRFELALVVERFLLLVERFLLVFVERFLLVARVVVRFLRRAEVVERFLAVVGRRRLVLLRELFLLELLLVELLLYCDAKNLRQKAMKLFWLPACLFICSGVQRPEQRHQSMNDCHMLVWQALRLVALLL